MPRLLCESGQMVGSDVEVSNDMTLGRIKGNTVTVDDPKASRKHLRLYKEEGAYYIEDLKSANGTYLNEVKITKTRIAYGDRIRIGRTVFVFLADPEQTLEGSKIGPYEIVKKIGPRGIGIVYKGTQRSLDRDVALKILDQDYADDPEFIERFRNEARQAGKVHHPNVVQVFDVGQSGSVHYVSMEWISGKPLRDYIGPDGSLSLEQILRIVREAALAMAVAHEQDVVHRELTPSNIILDEILTAKVAELGITKERRLDRKDLKTLYYISPEEARGMTPDDRSDIYSLGICFFEALAGRPPFKGEDTAEIINKHAREDLPDLGRIRPDLPSELVDLVRRMCAKLPKDRVQTMREAADRIERIETAMRQAPAPARQHAPSHQHAPSTRVEAGKKTSGATLGLEIVLTVFVCVILFFVFNMVTQFVLDMLSK